MKITVILEQGDNGYIVARCPSLKSCTSQGRTKDEALSNIQEAISLFLESDVHDIRAITKRHTERVELTL